MTSEFIRRIAKDGISSPHLRGGDFEGDIKSESITQSEEQTEQGLVEKIAEEGVRLYAFPNLWKRLTKSEKDNWRNWATKRILPLIKEAGYKSPEEISKGYMKLLPPRKRMDMYVAGDD